MEENNNESQKRLIELLKELSDIQASNMKLSFAIHTREFIERLDDNTKGLREGIAVMAKYYGAKAQKLAEEYIDGQNKTEEIKKYEARIDELRAGYKKGLSAINRKILRSENREQELILELENLGEERTEILNGEGKIAQKAKQLLERREELRRFAAGIVGNDETQMEEQLGDIVVELRQIKERYNQYKVQYSEMQRRQEEIEQEIQRVKQELEDVRELLKANKEEKERYKADNVAILNEIKFNKQQRHGVIALMPKQNIFQRIIGSVVNKINGLNKFKGEVKRRVEEMTAGISIAEENDNENDKDNAVETISEMIVKARAAKQDMIEKMQRKLEARKAKNQTLRERRETQKGNNSLEAPEENNVGDEPEF